MWQVDKGGTSVTNRQDEEHVHKYTRRQGIWGTSLNKKTREETSIKEMINFTRGTTSRQEIKGSSRGLYNGGLMGNL